MNREPEAVFAMESEPKPRQREWRSVPYGLKSLAGLLAMMFVLLLFWIGKTLIPRPQPISLLEVETRVDEQAKPGNDTQKAQTTARVLPPTAVSGDPKSPAAANQQTCPLAEAHPQTAALTQAITSLETTVTEQRIQSAAWQSQQTELSRSVQQQLTEQATKLQQLAELLNQKIAAKPKIVKRPKSKPAHHRKRRGQLTLPFDVVSIDQWGDQTYAVLRHNGQWLEKTSGQTLLDWQVVAINHDSQTLIVKNPQGQSQTLFIVSNPGRQNGH